MGAHIKFCYQDTKNIFVIIIKDLIDGYGFFEVRQIDSQAKQ
jgi:hypothetical protein